MKKVVVVLLIAVLLFGCGAIESMYEDVNYETLVGSDVDLRVYSGGKLVEEYKDAEVVYSNSDSQSLFIKDRNGQMHYIQGDIVADILDD